MTALIYPELYWPLRKTYPTGRRRKSLMKRLAEGVEITEGCWLWKGGINNGGYGRYRLTADGKRVYKSAHILVYELMKGPIPSGLQLDHLCYVEKCVNPDHLEPVTARENIRRAKQRRDQFPAQTGPNLTPRSQANE